MSSSPASPPASPSPDEAPSDSPIVETSVAETSPESSSSSDAPTSSDPEDVGSALSSDPDAEGGGAASATEPEAASATEPEAASVSSLAPSPSAASPSPSAASSAEPEVGLQPKAVSPFASEPRDTDSDYLCDSASSDSSTSPNSSTSPKKQTSATQPPRSYVTSLSFPGVEVHIKEHSFPLHVATCGICQYWKNRVAWSARASFLEKASGKRLSWLACSSVGQALCWPCASCSVGRDRFARGTGSFFLTNLLRHQRSKVPLEFHRAVERSFSSGG